MPKSRVRKKKVYTPPTAGKPATGSTSQSGRRPSPRWVPGLALVLFFVGIAWLVTYYMTQGSFPIEAITYWNLAIGFGALVAGLGVLTQWR